MLQTQHKQIIIIGGGPCGLAAAVELKKLGFDDILLLEREKNLGGILRQCIHDGFGLTRFQKTLSGPEYAQRFIDEANKLDIDMRTDTAVIDINSHKQVITTSSQGLNIYKADAVILAMGCRERTRGAISIPGSRPAGIFTAGVAQAYVNLKNLMIGKKVVILGSGDIGLIMARRLTLEGCHVQAVFEAQPYANGLPRNIEQCLHDYDIPLLLSHTITEIQGKQRLQGVIVSQVDENMQVIPGTERFYDCDTLILSVGLISENELSRKADIAIDGHTQGAFVDENYQTSVTGIFAAGNVLHVHDLVDFVSLEAERLAHGVAEYLSVGLPPCTIPVEVVGASYIIPQLISGQRDVKFYFRVRQPVNDSCIEIWQNKQRLLNKKIDKAIPAEMEHICLPAAAIRSEDPIKVVIYDA
jgi:thioredoxin reductase